MIGPCAVCGVDDGYLIAQGLTWTVGDQTFSTPPMFGRRHICFVLQEVGE